MRLGFAIAVNVDPEILLVDEVLAVGDQEFQDKCTGADGAAQGSEGRTLVLVTHSLAQAESFCTRAVVMDHGVPAYDGPMAGAGRRLRPLVPQLAEDPA